MHSFFEENNGENRTEYICLLRSSENSGWFQFLHSELSYGFKEPTVMVTFCMRDVEYWYFYSKASNLF